MTPICETFNRNMRINKVERKANGDIEIKHYCGYNDYKKITHEKCKENKNNVLIYKNGEGYTKNIKIAENERFKNLIGCWCNGNLRFENEEELLKHVEGNTHPEEFSFP